MKNRKVGILTFHRARNIGTCLQAFALQKFLEEQGTEVNIVDYRPQYIEDSFGVFLKDRYREAKRNIKSLVVFWFKTILRFPFTVVREYKFKKFREKYFNMSEKFFCNEAEMQSAELDYTHYFFGSDQIWNPELTEGIDSVFFGSFAKKAKKISYAASLGANILSDKEKEKLTNLVMQLDEVGVREISAKEMLEKECEKDISLNIDPTLLIEKDVWNKMAERRLYQGKYIFVYALEINEELIKIVRNLAETKNLKVIFCDLKNRYGKNGISRFATDPAEFLSLIRYADYVVTNSFHGTVFSIVFEKQFLSVPHMTRSTRVKDLLGLLEIPERVVYKFDECIDIDSVIDYEKVKKNIEEMRKKSVGYIEKTLK